MATTKASSVKKGEKQAAQPCEDQIRLHAYFKWESVTGGNPVDDEATRRFWEEAKQELIEGKLELDDIG